MHFIWMHMYNMKKAGQDLQHDDWKWFSWCLNFLDLGFLWEWFSLYAVLNFESIHLKHIELNIILLLWFISDSFSDEVLLEEDEEEEEEGDENMEENKPVEPPPQVRPNFHFFTIGSPD